MLSQNVRTFHYLNISLPFPNIIYSIHTYEIENFHIEMFRGTGKCKIKAKCETWAGNCMSERALVRMDGCQRKHRERRDRGQSLNLRL